MILKIFTASQPTAQYLQQSVAWTFLKHLHANPKKEFMIKPLGHNVEVPCQHLPHTNVLLILNQLHPPSLFQSVLCLFMWYITWPVFIISADVFPSHTLVLLTYRAPVRSDLPVGADTELTRLCGLGWGEAGAALWVDHGRAVSKALPALELPLLHPGATGHTALWPWTGLPAERNSEGEREGYVENTTYHMPSDVLLFQ